MVVCIDVECFVVYVQLMVVFGGGVEMGSDVLKDEVVVVVVVLGMKFVVVVVWFVEVVIIGVFGVLVVW